MFPFIESEDKLYKSIERGTIKYIAQLLVIIKVEERLTKIDFIVILIINGYYDRIVKSDVKVALEVNKTLEAYISFLPPRGQELILTSREEDSDPISVLIAIHWVCHHPEVDDKLSVLIVKELNSIIDKLGNSTDSNFSIKSVASLSLTPDKCFTECFNKWEDYWYIRKALPFLESLIGRPMYLLPNPNETFSLGKRLRNEAALRKREKNNGNK